MKMAKNIKRSLKVACAVTLSIAVQYAATLQVASAQQLNPQQVQLIKDIAVTICNTVKEAKGHKTALQVQGDVRTQLASITAKVADASLTGTGAVTTEEFEGFTQEATTIALMDDRRCRERIFNKMYGGSPQKAPPPAAAKTPTASAPKTKTASFTCRNPPQHYFCDQSGCLHRTFNGAMMGLPRIRKCEVR